MTNRMVMVALAVGFLGCGDAGGTSPPAIDPRCVFASDPNLVSARLTEGPECEYQCRMSTLGPFQQRWCPATATRVPHCSDLNEIEHCGNCATQCSTGAACVPRDASGTFWCFAN